MKVGVFVFYPPTLWNHGGGEVYCDTLLRTLQEQGVDAERVDPWAPKQYDLIHVIGSSYHVADFVIAAKSRGIRVVVTAFAYSIRPRWHWDLWRLVDRWLPIPSIYTLRRRLYQTTDMTLCSSHAEKAQLCDYFNIPKDKATVMRIACDARFADAKPEPFVQVFGLKDFVLMVSRISVLKGQGRLLHALDPLKIPLVFIGGPHPDEADYFARFQEECRQRPWVRYLGTLPHESELLPSAYAAAKVHALVSLNDYPGIVNLEAAVAGANVVCMDHIAAREYLGERAWYCNPRSLPSIRKAVLAAYQAPRRPDTGQELLRTLSWDRIVRQMIGVYEQVLGSAPSPAAETPADFAEAGSRR